MKGNIVRSVIKQAFDFQNIDALLRSAGQRIYCESAQGLSPSATGSVGSVLGFISTGLRDLPSSFSPAGRGRPERSATVGKISTNSARTAVRLPTLASIQGAEIMSGTRAPSSLDPERIVPSEYPSRKSINASGGAYQLVNFCQSPCSPRLQP